jgi:hypothetical protein
MIEWLLLPGNQIEAARKLLGGAWSGGARIALVQPTARSRALTVITPESARAHRAPRLPDVLSDWVDIYEEPLFPSPLLPVAGEVLSERGEDTLALHADLGDPARPRGGIAWYEKGALVELEQVGKSAVAWRRGEALSRPTLAGARSQLASLGRARADDDAEAGLYDRVASGLAATAEALIARALIRLLADDPPPLNELAAAVLRAPNGTLRL